MSEAEYSSIRWGISGVMVIAVDLVQSTGGGQTLQDTAILCLHALPPNNYVFRSMGILSNISR